MTAVFGVVARDVVAVERLVVEADDIGVKGEPLECGEASIILADFGGTSGGMLSELNRVFEFW